MSSNPPTDGDVCSIYLYSKSKEMTFLFRLLFSNYFSDEQHRFLIEGDSSEIPWCLDQNALEISFNLLLLFDWILDYLVLEFPMLSTSALMYLFSVWISL